MSARFQALYIRADTRERWAKIEADVRGRQEYFDCVPPVVNGMVEHGAAGESPDLANARTIAVAASTYFGDATYAGFQENVGSFVFVRCVDGELRRHLQYAADAGWMVVEGEPEPWEAEVLFSEERRQAFLRDADASGEDDGARQRTDVEAVFRRRRLQQGDVLPWIWSDQLFREVLGRLRS